MIVFFNGVTTDNLAIIDAEYNEGDIIQFAGLMFRKIATSLYQVSKSINLYIQLPKGKYVNSFIKKFTGISTRFLEKDGTPIQEARKEIREFFEVEGTLGVVAHDLQNDLDFLYNNEIHIEELIDELMCSYKLAQKVYGQNQKLNLKTLAFEAGFKHDNTHNALDDVWATIAVFSLLKKLEQELMENEVSQSQRT